MLDVFVLGFGNGYELGDLRGRVVTRIGWGVLVLFRFEFGGRNWVVKVSHPDYAARRIPIEVKQTQAPMRVTLEPGGSGAQAHLSVIRMGLRP